MSSQKAAMCSFTVCHCEIKTLWFPSSFFYVLQFLLCKFFFPFKLMTLSDLKLPNCCHLRSMLLLSAITHHWGRDKYPSVNVDMCERDDCSENGSQKICLIEVCSMFSGLFAAVLLPQLLFWLSSELADPNQTCLDLSFWINFWTAVKTKNNSCWSMIIL